MFGILKEKVKSDKLGDRSHNSSVADIDMTGGIPESVSSAESTPETSLTEASFENKKDFIKQNPSIEAIKPTPANLKESIIIPKPRQKHFGKKKKKKRIGKSDPYFVALFWVFAISRVWMNLWILPIIPFFIVFYVAKNAFIRLELAQFFMEKLKEQDVSNRFLAREDVIIPSPIKTLLIMLRLVDRKVRLFYCYLVLGPKNWFDSIEIKIQSENKDTSSVLVLRRQGNIFVIKSNYRMGLLHELFFGGKQFHDSIFNLHFFVTIIYTFRGDSF